MTKRIVTGSLCALVASLGQTGVGGEQSASVSPPDVTVNVQSEPAHEQTAATATNSAVVLPAVTVTGDLDRARDQIAPSLGAVTYTIGPNQIQAIPQGENAPFSQVLLRAPGVVADSFGEVHVRGEHGDLTYRVNGVLLPEGLNGFGQEIDTRLINSVTLITGTLPAQYGFRTAGIVDVSTKTGRQLNGGEVSFYGGSLNTINPSVQFGGTSGKVDYFATASYLHNDIGIENPTPSYYPIHDTTDQGRLFDYFSYCIDESSRLSLLLNGAYADFELPNTPGLPQKYQLAGTPTADSAKVDENQNEQNYSAVLSYQKTAGELSFQASAYSVRSVFFNFDGDVYASLGLEGGGYAEYAVAKEALVAAKPRTLDHVQAAAVPTGGITAWQALFKVAQLRAGQKVLIHGAAGGVGNFAVQFAKTRGAYVIGTASARNQSLLRELGTDEAVDYNKTRFEDVVRDVDVVLDTIGGDTRERSFKVLKKGGVLVSIVQPPSAELASKREVRAMFYGAHPSSSDLAEIAKLIDSGKVKPVIETVLPLAEVRQAHELSQSGHARGKIVLKAA